MVFQHYALFPHMTVGENVAFGLEAQKLPRADVERRVAESLAAVDLAGFERRRIARDFRRSAAARGAGARARAQPRVLPASTSRSRTSIRRCASARGAS